MPVPSRRMGGMNARLPPDNRNPCDRVLSPVNLRVAGISLRIDGGWAAATDLRDQYARYEEAADSPSDTVFVGLEGAGPSASSSSILVFEKGGSRMTLDVEARRVWISPQTPAFLVDRLLMHATACFLALKSTVILHAAAVEGPAGAIGFIGRSESGKTTAAQNCPTRLIHPDRVAVRFEGAAPWLEPLPFLYGEPKTGSLAGMRLSRLFLIRKGLENRVQELTPGEQVRAVASGVLWPPDRRLSRLVFAAIERLLAVVGVDVLAARVDGGFWSLLDIQGRVAPPEEAV